MYILLSIHIKECSGFLSFINHLVSSLIIFIIIQVRGLWNTDESLIMSISIIFELTKEIRHKTPRGIPLESGRTNLIKNL